MTWTLIHRFRRDVGRIRQEIEKAEADETSFDPRFVELVLALEDNRFFSHAGVDMVAVIRATAHLLRGRPRGGASTIDMQLARTVTGYRARTLSRKLYEAALAIATRRAKTPENILNAYLAIAFFGTGLIGAEAAAKKLFARKITSLSESECSEIAALLVYPAPRELHRTWRQKVRQRADYGLARLSARSPARALQGSVAFRAECHAKTTRRGFTRLPRRIL